jgi:hypothetical protein
MHYHLYWFSNGEIYHCEDLEAPDDEAALEQAHELGAFAAAELWEDDRKVHAFRAGLELV